MDRRILSILHTLDMYLIVVMHFHNEEFRDLVSDDVVSRADRNAPLKLS